MSSKSKFVCVTIDSIAHMPISKGHKRSVAIHKARKWCLTDKDKKLVNFMKENLVPYKVIKRRNK